MAGKNVDEVPQGQRLPGGAKIQTFEPTDFQPDAMTTRPR